MLHSDEWEVFIPVRFMDLLLAYTYFLLTVRTQTLHNINTSKIIFIVIREIRINVLNTSNIIPQVYIIFNKLLSLHTNLTYTETEYIEAKKV